jgi:ribosome biogenesis GTPase / thiamine phosphate phosphatase
VSGSPNVASAVSLDLFSLGWRPFFAEHFLPYAAQGFLPGRVAIEHKVAYRVYLEMGEVTASLAGKLRHRALVRADLPAVGDWVAVRSEAGAHTGTIQAVLPRQSKFSRKVAGAATTEQIVATNVDTVFLVVALGQDWSPRRLERYLLLAAESGARPVVVLNKVDRCPDVAASVRAAAAVAPGVAVHAISARQGDGVPELTPYLGRGQTVALLGSSGVGKSTLINRLLRRDLLLTQEVRAHDQRGRHTTTHRELVVLPEGGVLVDTPGMRELQLWAGDEPTAQDFEDVEALAAACYFSNCQHRAEPDCAVRAAIAAGELAAERLDHYEQLQRERAALEARQDHLAQLAAKRAVRSVTRLVNRHQPRR